MEFQVGDRVELRKHAARNIYRLTGVRGEVTEVATFDGATQVHVRWEGWWTSWTPPASFPPSSLMTYRETRSRRRHDELYGTGGMQDRVEEAGTRLREALRETYVPESCKREGLLPTGHQPDFKGADYGDLDDARRDYDRLVQRFNELARRHDEDGCC